METLPDKKLIENYLKGDTKSFDKLIENYLKIIYNFVYKNVGNEFDAEDITQEVFVKVWKNIKKFDTSKDFKPWIFQIARNTLIDLIRKKKSIPFSRFENEKGQNPLIEALVDTPENLIENISDKTIIKNATTELGNNDKKLIEMKGIEGLNFREISEKLGISINTVKSRYRRIIMSLRKIIKK